MSIIVYRRRKTGIQPQASARPMKQTMPPVLMSPSATRNYCCSNAAKPTTQSQSCTYTCTFIVHLLCSGLNNEDERQSAPLTETLFCTPTRRASSRCAGETGAREKNATENEREMLMRRACARALSPRSFLLLEHRLQPTPSPLCGLASWHLLGACPMYPGEQFLT